MSEMTSEQFNEFMKKISLRQEDHDTLIRIEQIVASNAASFDIYKQDAAVKISEAKASAVSAHKRIDEEVKARWMFAGGTALMSLIALVITIVIGIIKISESNAMRHYIAQEKVLDEKIGSNSSSFRSLGS